MAAFMKPTKASLTRQSASNAPVTPKPGSGATGPLARAKGIDATTTSNASAIEDNGGITEEDGTYATRTKAAINFFLRARQFIRLFQHLEEHDPDSRGLSKAKNDDAEILALVRRMAAVKDADYDEPDFDEKWRTNPKSFSSAWTHMKKAATSWAGKQGEPKGEEVTGYEEGQQSYDAVSAASTAVSAAAVTALPAAVVPNRQDGHGLAKAQGEDRGGINPSPAPRVVAPPTAADEYRSPDSAYEKVAAPVVAASGPSSFRYPDDSSGRSREKQGETRELTASDLPAQASTPRRPGTYAVGGHTLLDRLLLVGTRSDGAALMALARQAADRRTTAGQQLDNQIRAADLRHSPESGEGTAAGTEAYDMQTFPGGLGSQHAAGYGNYRPSKQPTPAVTQAGTESTQGPKLTEGIGRFKKAWVESENDPAQHPREFRPAHSADQGTKDQTKFSFQTVISSPPDEPLRATDLAAPRPNAAQDMGAPRDKGVSQPEKQPEVAIARNGSEISCEKMNDFWDWLINVHRPQRRREKRKELVG